LVKTAQIKSLKTNIDKVAKFGSSILIVYGQIKEKVEDEDKIEKIEKAKDLIELWKGLLSLIRGLNERKIKFGSQFSQN
jgi:hypothetical protein